MSILVCTEQKRKKESSTCINPLPPLILSWSALRLSSRLEINCTALQDFLYFLPWNSWWRPDREELLKSCCQFRCSMQEVMSACWQSVLAGRTGIGTVRSDVDGGGDASSDAASSGTVANELCVSCCVATGQKQCSISVITPHQHVIHGLHSADLIIWTLAAAVWPLTGWKRKKRKKWQWLVEKKEKEEKETIKVCDWYQQVKSGFQNLSFAPKAAHVTG